MFIALLLVTFSDSFCKVFQITEHYDVIAPFIWLGFLGSGVYTVCFANLLSWRGMKVGALLCLGKIV
jgi:hypothetical protein